MSKRRGDQARRSQFLIAALAVCALGCSRTERPAPDGPQASGTSADAAEAIVLKPVNRAAYDATIAGLRGKVVLVDFWATWCLPCLAQLPHTVELAEKHRDDGLAVLTVCMDDSDEAAQAKVLLAARRAVTLTHLLSQEGGGSEAMDAFEIDGGAVPHYKLYDRAGKLRRTFAIDPAAEKQFTGEDIAAAVAELLAE